MGPIAPAGVLAGDGSAGAPSYSFASAPTTGFWTSSNVIRASSNGTHVGSWGVAGLIANAVILDNTNQDVSLSRGAADVLLLASGDKLAFGGVTTSFPLLKNNGAQLLCRLGDDSALANFACSAVSAGGTVAAASGTATPAGGSAGVSVTVGSANVGLYIGTGAPSVSAAKGSIYTNTTATTTTTRLYVNTDGGTTWTNLTTAA